MPDEMNEFPTILIFFGRILSPRRHSRETNAVVNNVEQLSVGQGLGFGQSHVGSLRVQVLSNLGLPAAVICVTGSAVIGEVRPGISQNLLARLDWILGPARASRGRETAQTAS